MKVLLVIPKLYNGGIEKVASNFSLNLNENFEQYVFAIMSQNDSYDFKVKPTILDRSIEKGGVGKFKNFLYRVFTLRKIVNDENIDVVISFGERCNIITMVSLLKCKKILTIHSQLSIENQKKGIYGFIGTQLAKRLYKYASSIVAVSHIVKNDFIKLLDIEPDRVDVIYNGHDLDNIKRIAITQDYVSSSDIITVGRITYAKGHFHLLRALSLVKKELPDISLKIVGDYEEDDLKILIQQLLDMYSLNNNVTFTGYEENPYKHIVNSKVFVLSSIFEGLPGVVIESLALGIPIVTSDSGGATEILKKGGKEQSLGEISPSLNGIYDLTSPISFAEKELARKIVKVVKNHNKYDKSISQKMSEQYSIENMMNSYTELLLKVGK